MRPGRRLVQVRFSDLLEMIASFDYLYSLFFVSDFEDIQVLNHTVVVDIFDFKL